MLAGQRVFGYTIPPLKRRGKAIIIGCLIEIMFMGLCAIGGFGPCGPTGVASGIGLAGHLPALLIFGMFMDAMPEFVAAPLIVITMIVFWSLVAYVIMDIFAKRAARKAANPPQ